MLVMNGIALDSDKDRRNAEYLAMLDESEKQIREGKYYTFTDENLDNFAAGKYTEDEFRELGRKNNGTTAIL